jgi:hypothetical protein
MPVDHRMDLAAVETCSSLRLSPCVRWAAHVALLCSSFSIPAFATCHDTNGTLIPNVTVTSRIPGSAASIPRLSIAWSGWLVESTSEFNKQPLKHWIDLAADCANQPAAPDIIKLQVFSSAQDALRTRHPPKGAHQTFAEWVRLYKDYKPEPMAQVVMFGKTLMTAYRVDESGRPDVAPTPDFHPADYNLVDVVVQKSEIRSPEVDGQVTLYVQSKQLLSRAAAANLADAVAGSSRFPALSIEIRPDRWFIESLSFPIADRSQAIQDGDSWSKMPAPSHYSREDRQVCNREPRSGKFVCAP